MEKNIENTCRACLRQQSSLKNLLSEYTEGSTGIKLSHIFQNCTNIDLPQEPDALPQMICIMCELTLKTCYYFRLQCTQANDEYSTIYNKPEEFEMLKEEEPILEEYDFIKENAVKISVKIEEPLSINDNEMLNNDAEASIEYNDPGTSSVVEEIPMPVEIIKRDTFVCNKCHKNFMSRRYLEIHLKTHQNQQYCCEICGKKCSSKSVLRIHLKKHSTTVDDESAVGVDLI